MEYLLKRPTLQTALKNHTMRVSVFLEGLFALLSGIKKHRGSSPPGRCSAQEWWCWEVWRQDSKLGQCAGNVFEHIHRDFCITNQEWNRTLNFPCHTSLLLEVAQMSSFIGFFFLLCLFFFPTQHLPWRLGLWGIYSALFLCVGPASVVFSVHDKCCEQRPIRLYRKRADDSTATALIAVRITGLSHTSCPEPEWGCGNALKGQAVFHSLCLFFCSSPRTSHSCVVLISGAVHAPVPKCSALLAAAQVLCHWGSAATSGCDFKSKMVMFLNMMLDWNGLLLLFGQPCRIDFHLMFLLLPLVLHWW